MWYCPLETIIPSVQERTKVVLGPLFKEIMKSKDLREVVMRTTDDGMTSIQISKQLRSVVSQGTISR